MKASRGGRAGFVAAVDEVLLENVFVGGAVDGVGFGAAAAATAGAEAFASVELLGAAAALDATFEAGAISASSLTSYFLHQLAREAAAGGRAVAGGGKWRQDNSHLRCASEGPDLPLDSPNKLSLEVML
jgi:hypothetical protein